MKNKNKSILLIAMVVVLLTVTVSGTLAYLMDVSGEVVNTFAPSKVTCKVVEDGWSDDSETKSRVQIENTGDTEAYIRAAVVANWCDDEGRVIASYDPTITPGDNWIKDGDYYYYSLKVSAGKLTGNLLKEPITTPKTAPANASHLEVTIVCQAIQASGMGASGAIDAFNKAAQ